MFETSLRSLYENDHTLLYHGAYIIGLLKFEWDKLNVEDIFMILKYLDTSLLNINVSTAFHWIVVLIIILIYTLNKLFIHLSVITFVIDIVILHIAHSFIYSLIYWSVCLNLFFESLSMPQ